MNYLQAWDGAMYPPHVVAAALIEQYRDTIWHYGWRNRQPTGVAHGICVVRTSEAQAPAGAPAKGAGSSSPVLVDA